MRKASIVCMALLVVACSDSNRGEVVELSAKEKLAECELDMEAAILAKNEEKIKAILQDEECLKANEIVQQQAYERHLAEKKAEIAKREQARQEADAAYEAEYQQHLAELANKSLVDLTPPTQECRRNVSFQRGAYCNAVLAQYDKVRENEIAKLVEDHTLQSLDNEYQQRCRTILNNSACKLLNDAIRVEKDQLLARYKAEPDKHKADFNACHHEYQRLRTQQDFKAAGNLIRTPVCQTALKAAKDKGVYSYRSPL